MAYLKVKCLLVLVCFALYFADAKISKTKVSSRQSGNSAGCQQNVQRYVAQTQKKTFWEAWRHCLDIGLRLAIINNRQDNDLVMEAIGGKTTSKEPYWIGGTNIGRGSTFVWIATSQPIAKNYTNFAAGEPNNENGNENCVDIGTKGDTWYDKPCDRAQKFVCENTSK